MNLNKTKGIRAFIQGASRGLGLAMVRQLLEKPEVSMVYASCREPDEAEQLNALARDFPERLAIVQLDLAEETSIKMVARDLKKSQQRLHLLVNCAGILHQADVSMHPEKRIEDLESSHLELAFKVNAIGPLLVLKHFLPFFKHEEPSVLANISAKVGSISDNRLGGWYSYRASKAAQNMLTKTFSIELMRRCPASIIVALHPGTVDTELSRPFQGNVPKERLFTPERAASQLVAILFNLKPSDNGAFISWDGQELTW